MIIQEFTFTSWEWMSIALKLTLKINRPIRFNDEIDKTSICKRNTTKKYNDY